MFSLVCALPSPASAESCPPLFGWFTGSTAQSDFSGTYMSAVRLVAFADRPCSSDQGVLDISRFSCMLFLSVRGFSDYAGPTVHSRLAWLPCCLPLTRNKVGILIYGLFAAQSPRPPMPLSTLQETPRGVPSKTRGQDGFATSFPVGLLHPLQHAGLSRRTPVCPSTDRDRQLFAASFFGGAGSLIHGRVVILSPRLRGLVLDKSSAAETTKMYRTGDEAQNSSSHTYSLACARGPIRRKRCLQRLLVHVLANRQRVSQKAARDEQGGISRSREEGSSAGLARFRWRFGRWVVSAYAPRCLAVA